MIEQGGTDLHGTLQAGIDAAKAKQKREAYRLLKQVVERDPENEQGWLWLGAVAPTAAESLDAFGHVLAINPANEHAYQGQRWALSRLTRPVAASPPGATPVPPAPAPPVQQTPAPTPPPDTASISAPPPPDATPITPEPPEVAPPATAYTPRRSKLTAPLVMPADQLSEAAQPEIVDWRSDGDLTVEPDAFHLIEQAAPPAFVPAVQREQAPHYIDTIRPVGSRTSMVTLLLGALVLLAGLLLVVYGLLSSASGSGPFDNVGQKFFQAQLAKNYDAAAGYLTPELQQTYLNGHDLPGANLIQSLGGQSSLTMDPEKPLARSADGVEARSVVTITSSTGEQVKYEVALTHAGGKWLITGISPYPLAP